MQFQILSNITVIYSDMYKVDISMSLKKMSTWFYASYVFKINVSHIEIMCVTMTDLLIAELVSSSSD